MEMEVCMEVEIMEKSWIDVILLAIEKIQIVVTHYVKNKKYFTV